MGRGNNKSETNVEQVQWPNSGCFPTNGAWKPAIAGFRSVPAPIPVALSAPTEASLSLRRAVPLSVAVMEAAAPGPGSWSQTADGGRLGSF